MIKAQIQFDDNINRARDLGRLFVGITSQAKMPMDLTDLLRAQLVLAVSTLDHFVHELCRIGMIEAAKGLRTKTDAYKRFQIPLGAVDQGTLGVQEEIWLGNAIQERHSWLSFQDPEKVADAMRLISSVELWKEVGASLSITADDIKRRLKLIVERRNKIAHESDMDPTFPNTRWPINEKQTTDAVNSIQEIGNAIYKLVKI